MLPVEGERKHKQIMVAIEKLIVDVHIVGLSAGQRFTCQTLATEDCFWCESGLTVDRYKALFSWAKNDDTFWKTKWMGKAECERVNEDGSVMNGVIIEVYSID